MKRFFCDLRFYESYSYAQSISNILSDQFAYMRALNDFYGDEQIASFSVSFPKYSALHRFIEIVVFETLYDANIEVDLVKRQTQIEKYGIDRMHKFGWFPEKLPLDLAYEFYGLEHQPFVDWLSEHGKDFVRAENDDISEFLEGLQFTQEWQSLIDRIVEEVFFILFQNRQLLLIFNEMMAAKMKDADLEGVSEDLLPYFVGTGQLRRVRTPEWVKRAIFYRDRGLCVICSCDLSGLLLLSNAEHFDHIVPLAEGGLNDVTNIQLLCADCNLKKAHRSTSTSTLYETWYPLAD